MKKIFFWISGGAILTTVAFFIPEQSGSMWPSVIAGATVAFLYFGGVLRGLVKRDTITNEEKSHSCCFYSAVCVFYFLCSN